MRQELLDYLRGLSDFDYQRRVWVDGQREGSIEHDELNYAVHFLYDDTALAKNPRSTIGVFLYDVAEADAVEMLVSVLDGIFQKYGTNLSDSQYIGLPEWTSVIQAAQWVLGRLR
jgi:hypothetical protein